MGRRSTPTLPQVQRQLQALGQALRLARLRRQLTAGLVAERAGMARDTLRALEQGDPGVSLGSLANVLNALGLAKELSKLAVDDETGRMLQDARLEQRVRPARPRTRKPPRGTVDLVSLVEANPSEAKGPALVWNAERSWIQTFMPGEPPRERALDALGLGELVTIMEVVSTGGPIFVLIKTEEGDERVVMLADLRRKVASRT